MWLFRILDLMSSFFVRILSTLIISEWERENPNQSDWVGSKLGKKCFEKMLSFSKISNSSKKYEKTLEWKSNFVRFSIEICQKLEKLQLNLAKAHGGESYSLWCVQLQLWIDSLSCFSHRVRALTTHTISICFHLYVQEMTTPIRAVQSNFRSFEWWWWLRRWRWQQTSKQEMHQTIAKLYLNMIYGNRDDVTTTPMKLP